MCFAIHRDRQPRCSSPGTMHLAYACMPCTPRNRGAMLLFFFAVRNGRLAACGGRERYIYITLGSKQLVEPGLDGLILRGGATPAQRTDMTWAFMQQSVMEAALPSAGAVQDAMSRRTPFSRREEEIHVCPSRNISIYRLSQPRRVDEMDIGLSQQGTSYL